MNHRLFSVLLSAEIFMREKEYINHTGVKNERLPTIDYRKSHEEKSETTRKTGIDIFHQ